MVSAAKFRRAQNAIIGMRPYAAKMQEIIADIDVEDGVTTPYHEKRQVRNVLIVVVTSNKGLCGAFNSNVIKQASARLSHYASQPSAPTVKMVTVGKRGSEFFSKQEGLVVASYDALLDNPAFDSITELCEKIMASFCDKTYDTVEVVYNQFKNSLTQILSTEQMLPIKSVERGTESTERRNDYIFEPGKEQILREMIPMMLRTNFYRVILDSLASEHGARMTAMQKATDNATELLKELKLSYNKARQAAITNEIIEIVSGSEALKG